jgi:hypothetical protein
MKIKKFNEMNESKNGKTIITHNTVAGDENSIEIDLTDLDTFIKKLGPLLSNKNITDSNRKDIVTYIIKNIGGYSTLGGGKITFK